MSTPPTPPPKAVTYREDLDGVHIRLPPPRWSRRPTLHSFITISAGLIGFATAFVLSLMLCGMLNLPGIFIAPLGFVGMFLLMMSADKLRTWHYRRLHSVHLTLTPNAVEVTHRKYVHKSYLSDIKTNENDTLDLWQDAHDDVLSRLGSQPDEVQEWTTRTIEAWLHAHLQRQGSHDEVPRLLHTLSPSVRHKH